MLPLLVMFVVGDVVVVVAVVGDVCCCWRCCW